MKSATQWTKELQVLAKEAFAEHQMKEVGPGHWRIQRPGEQQYWADIAVMGNVALSVWGDIDGCFFAYCSGAKSPEGVVAWMGTADACYYGRQKAHIGMGGPELVDDYVDEVALYDLDTCLAQKEEEHEPEDWSEPRGDGPSPQMTYTDAFGEARERIGRGEHMSIVHNELMDELRDIEPDAYEWVYSIGQVTSVRVIYALAAVARLHELLQQG